MFPEYDFIASCLRLGLTLQDLSNLTYVEVLKIFISFIHNSGDPRTDMNGIKSATQSDIDRLLR